MSKRDAAAARSRLRSGGALAGSRAVRCRDTGRGVKTRSVLGRASAGCRDVEPCFRSVGGACTMDQRLGGGRNVLDEIVRVAAPERIVLFGSAARDDAG